jgi:hypothetical protein
LQENIASTSNAQLGYDGPIYGMPHPFNHTNKNKPLEQVSNLREFMVSCLNLLNDQTSTQVLQILLSKCNLEEEIKLEKKTINHVHRKIIKNKEFRLNENIGEFNMGDIILYFGF